MSLVDVYVSVTGRDGRPIEGLTSADFEVLEDGHPQTVAAFAAGRVPLSLAIGIDRSFSMSAGRDRLLPLAKSTARALIAALTPDDQVMVVGIGSGVDVVSPLTRDRAAALSAVNELDAWGTTPLYDATREAIEAVQAGSGRRALILLSDGADRDSVTTPADLLEFARRRDVLVYPIAVATSTVPAFAELASVTGGRSFASRDLAQLQTFARQIADDLRLQYRVGYVPSRPPGEPRWRAIHVRVTRPDARVRARDGYFSR